MLSKIRYKNLKEGSSCEGINNIIIIKLYSFKNYIILLLIYRYINGIMGKI